MTRLPGAGRDGGAQPCVTGPGSRTCSGPPAVSSANERLSPGAGGQMEAQRGLARRLENHLSLIFVPQPPLRPRFMSLRGKNTQSEAVLT